MTARSCRSCNTPVPDDAAFCPNCGEATAADLDAEFGEGFEERLKQALSDRYTIEHALEPRPDVRTLRDTVPAGTGVTPGSATFSAGADGIYVEYR